MVSDKKKMTEIGLICVRHTPHQRTYTTFVSWAKAQERKGLRQTFCSDCQRWFFPQELGEKKVGEEK